MCPYLLLGNQQFLFIKKPLVDWPTCTPSLPEFREKKRARQKLVCFIYARGKNKHHCRVKISKTASRKNQNFDSWEIHCAHGFPFSTQDGMSPDPVFETPRVRSISPHLLKQVLPVDCFTSNLVLFHFAHIQPARAVWDVARGWDPWKPNLDLNLHLRIDKGLNDLCSIVLHRSTIHQRGLCCLIIQVKTHWAPARCPSHSTSAIHTGRSSSSKKGWVERDRNFAIHWSGTVSEMNFTATPPGSISTAPIEPTFVSSPSQAPSVKIIQVCKLVSLILVGGAQITLLRKKCIVLSSAAVNRSFFLPVEAIRLKFLSTCCANLPPANVSNHCNLLLSFSASFKDMTPLSSMASRAWHSSFTLVSVWPIVTCLALLSPAARLIFTPSAQTSVPHGTAFFPSLAKSTPNKLKRLSAATTTLLQQVCFDSKV